MIRRPLNERFSDAVLEERKITTIRDNPWPIGKPIMLFRWFGKPYRSKQVDIAPVMVESTGEIRITHRPDGGMLYAGPEIVDSIYRHGTDLHITEGFGTRSEMDEWFRPLVKPGQTVSKTLMRFRLWKGGDA